MQPAGTCVYVLLAGLPGTGKSTLAKELERGLAERDLKTVVLNKDDVRSTLFPGPATDYSDAQNNLCLSAMLEAAAYMRYQPDGPRFILFDGRTFSTAEDIASVISAAKSVGASWRILHLICPDELAEQRLATSAATHPARDRDYNLYLDLKSRFEPITQEHVTVDTSADLKDSTKLCLHYLTRPLPQSTLPE